MCLLFPLRVLSMEQQDLDSYMKRLITEFNNFKNTDVYKQKLPSDQRQGMGCGNEGYSADNNNVRSTGKRGSEFFIEHTGDKSAQKGIYERLDEEGNTIMHIAAMRGQESFLGNLWRNGVSMDIKNSSGQTPNQLLEIFKKQKNIVDCE